MERFDYLAVATGVDEYPASVVAFTKVLVSVFASSKVAGAKTVIMSLWRVEDETTRQWMATLYKEHFISGHNTVESVRAASLQILRQRRTKHQSTHPFYW